MYIHKAVTRRLYYFDIAGAPLYCSLLQQTVTSAPTHSVNSQVYSGQFTFTLETDPLTPEVLLL